MSVDSGGIDPKVRSCFSVNVFNGSVQRLCDDVLKDELPDCPPGFENPAGWGLSGFEGLCTIGMHGEDLSQIGDEMRLSAGSDTNFVDRKLVDFTKCTSRGCTVEILNNGTAARRKRNVKEVVESGYVAGSLVWGKIRSHSWWPGQLFDPADLTKEALRHFKDGKFLVAYFGDGGFAWNDATQIRPFQLNFERMESQSDLDTFCSAVDCVLDEVFKRVEFGLSCTCLPENVFADVQSQRVENSGIYKKIRKRDVRDDYSSAECFVPSKLLSFVKEAATPKEASNKLEMVKCKAQLTSFLRWKGYRMLPEYTSFLGLSDDTANVTNLEGEDSHRTVANNTHHVVSPNFGMTEGKGGRQHKRRGRPKGTARDDYSSVECFVPCKLLSFVKEAATPREVSNKLEMVKCKAQLTSFLRWKGYRMLPEYTYFLGLSDDTANVTNSEGEDSHWTVANNAHHVVSPNFGMTEDKGERQHKRRGRPKGTASQKRKKISHSEDDELYVPPSHVKYNRKAGRKVRLELETPTSENKISTSVCKSGKIKLDRVVSTRDTCITPSVERNVSEILSPDVLFKQLAYTATNQLHDHDYLIPLVKFFSQFRNSVFLNLSVSAESGIPVDMNNEMIGKVIPEYKYREPQSGHVEESYSEDRIVKESVANGCSLDSHDELPSVVPENATMLDLPILLSETVPKLQIFPDPYTEDTSGNQESAEGILNTSGDQVSDNHKDTTMQTALLLRFSEQSHVPSVTDLNKIFSCYGPLHESETKIMKRSLVKVIFKKHCDAKVAFSSTGKYSIFGPSLVSYRLKYLAAKPKTVSSKSRKRQKKAAPIERANATT